MKRSMKLVKNGLVALGFVVSTALNGIPYQIAYSVATALNPPTAVTSEAQGSEFASDIDVLNLVSRYETFFPDVSPERLDEIVGRDVARNYWSKTDEKKVDPSEYCEVSFEQTAQYYAEVNLAGGPLGRFRASETFVCDKSGMRVAVFDDSQGNAVIYFQGLVDIAKEYDDTIGPLVKPIRKKMSAGLEFTDDIIARNGYKKVILCGISGGGGVAQHVALASKFFDRIQKCVTFNAEGQSWLYKLGNVKQIQSRQYKIRNYANENDLVFVLYPQVGSEIILKDNFSRGSDLRWEGLKSAHHPSSVLDGETKFRTFTRKGAGRGLNRAAVEVGRNLPAAGALAALAIGRKKKMRKQLNR